MEFYNCRLSVQYYQWVNINKAMKRELMFIKDFRPVMVMINRLTIWRMMI